MPSKTSHKASWWKRVRDFLRTHTSLSVIVLAALLLELTTAVMYYAAQTTVQQTLQLLVMREMSAISLSIRNQLAKVEVTLDNMAWVVTDDLVSPDSLFRATYQLVDNNPAILGSSISCVPNLYPQCGYWFEPYSVRRADGSIETMQLGSASHDYTKKEFFTEPIARGTGFWSEPYLDSDGAREIVTSYGVPVRANDGKIVAVVDADISLGWLDGIMNKGKYYQSTQRFLLTGENHLLAGEDTLLCNTLIEKTKEYGKLGYFTLELHDKLKHAFYNEVGGKTDWKIICLVDDGDVFGELRQVRHFILLMILAGFLLLGFIVWRSSRNLQRLRLMNAEKQLISSELRVASKIQQSMLPHNYLKHDEVEINGSLVSARMVGGDLFDYFLRDGKLFFCIGDVSGKGVPSAIFMAVVQSLFRMASSGENNPANIMRDVNVTACRENDTCMFVTMFIGVLDLPTGHLRYCNAGHDAPFILSKGQWATLNADPHLPLGLYTDVNYGIEETWLEPESTIFLYTDGLTEAMDSEHRQFSLKRIVNQLEKSVGQKPAELLETVSHAVHEFVGEAEQSDDLTMLAIHYTPQQFKSTFSKTLTLMNDVREVTKLSTFQKSVFEQMNIDKQLSRQLRLAVEEAVVNVIEYAYPATTEGKVEIRMLSDGHKLKVMIIDEGIPFDPTVHEKADITLSVEERQVGGLGIHLLRELMDTVNYERIDGQNILTLIKRIE